MASLNALNHYICAMTEGVQRAQRSSYPQCGGYEGARAPNAVSPELAPRPVNSRRSTRPLSRVTLRRASYKVTAAALLGVWGIWGTVHWDLISDLDKCCVCTCVGACVRV